MLVPMIERPRLLCDGYEATGRDAVTEVRPSLLRKVLVVHGMQTADVGASNR